MNEKEQGLKNLFDNDTSNSIAIEPVSVGGDENVYSTSLKHESVVGGEYKSLVRFIKNIHATEEIGNIFSKYMYFLVDPDNTTGKLIVDCTSNWGQRDNIVTNAFFHCRNSGNPSLKTLGKDNFSRKQYYFSLLQIVKDMQQPTMEGMLKVFRFGKQVNDILDATAKGDPAVNLDPVNFSHPFAGRNFMIHVAEEEYEDSKTGFKKQMTSYKKSKFMDKTTPLVVPDYDRDLIKPNDEYKMAIYNYINDGAPMLADYAAKRWDAITEERIIESVRVTLEDPHHFDKVYKKTYKKAFTGGYGGASADSAGSAGLDLSAANMEKTPAGDPPAGDTYGEVDEIPASMAAEETKATPPAEETKATPPAEEAKATPPAEEASQEFEQFEEFEDFGK